tara:strand:- start:65 stop:1063 length:999 start_codon:yes stop_codon:yes gene_type:complete
MVSSNENSSENKLMDKILNDNNSTDTNNSSNSESEQNKPVTMTIQDAVKLYLSKNKIKLLIGTPCYGGLCHTGYMQSLMELAANFVRLNIPYELMTIGNESLIPRARNGIVAKFMANEELTHLIFIDADITFSWVSVVKLILSDKDVSGGCYPKKMINWKKVRHNLTNQADINEPELIAKSLDYVFNPVYFKQGDSLVAQVDNGLVKVKDIGTGFMMIKKQVIETMMYKFPELQYRNNVAGYHENDKIEEYFYTLFDTCIDSKSKVYLSEDYLFCQRWLECGGDLWLDLSTNLNHTGTMEFRGCLSLNINSVDTMNQDAEMLMNQKNSIGSI